MKENIPPLEYKGYKALLTLNSDDNRIWGKICTPENPLTPIDNWGFAGDDIEEARELFHSQVDNIISNKLFNERCQEWKSNTDYESVRCVMNILPDEFEQRIKDNKFDNSLLMLVKGGDYEVPLYYATKAWDIILKGELFPIDFMIGPEEDINCTEEDIKEFLEENNCTRSRCEACKDNDKMKKLWKEYLNIDIDSLEIDFLQYNMHLPPNINRDEYQDYFMDVPDGIDEWIMGGINYPDSEYVSHDGLSALMEFTAEVLLRRMGKL